MIEKVLKITNKEITKLKYEGEFDDKPDVIDMIDSLQYHIFLIHTYFDKQEFETSDVRLKLLE